MLIRIGYDIALQLSSPTALIYLLQVHPSRAADLQGPEQTTWSPALPTDFYRDGFDNLCARIQVPAGVQQLRLRNQAVVRDSGLPDPVELGACEHPVAELPVECLQFLLPSRYCDFDGELLAMAWNTFAQVAPGWSRVQAICDHVHARLRFDYTLARATRTAREAWHERVGVCRDFAHLAIALCRSMNIPARYATGYLGDIGVPAMPDPMDFSAWFEVYLSGRWHTFDARHNTPRIGRVLLARGRDAADVPITMVFGQHQLTQFTVVTEEI
jgi:transglutaminase-like putative cysteine protease